MRTGNPRGKRVFVEVSATRLEVALGGAADLTKVEHHAGADWVAQWPACLKTLDATLARLVGEVGGTGLPATIIYHAPSAVTGVFACPASAGKPAADQAARLALAGSCSFPLEDNASGVFPLRTDPANKNNAAAPQAYTLGLADTDESAEAVAQWARRAGLLVDRLVPAEAVAAIGAVLASEESGGDSDVCAALWMGEHTSVLAAMQGGRTCFVRTLSVGSELLVDALTRPIRPRGLAADGSPKAPVTLDKRAARAMLAKAGVPAQDLVIDQERGIEGSGLLPLLQPVLQRLAIEIKQSLRFGMDEAAKANIKLLIAGPGAAVPNLAATISRQTSLPAEAVKPPSTDTGNAPPPPTSADAGLISVLRAPGASAAAILPRSLERAATLQLVRRGIWVGLAASIGLVVWEGAQARQTLKDETARLDKLRLQTAPQVTPAQEQAQVFTDKAAAYDERIRESMGEWVDWRTVLGLLAEKTPESIRLTGLEFTFNSGGACKLAGYVDIANATEAASVIGKYMSSLGGVPLVKAVDLGATQQVRREGRGVQQFELNINLIGLPAIAEAAVKDAAPVLAGETGAQ